MVSVIDTSLCEKGRATWCKRKRKVRKVDMFACTDLKELGEHISNGHTGARKRTGWLGVGAGAEKTFHYEPLKPLNCNVTATTCSETNLCKFQM